MADTAADTPTDAASAGPQGTPGAGGGSVAQGADAAEGGSPAAQATPGGQQDLQSELATERQRRSDMQGEFDKRTERVKELETQVEAYQQAHGPLPDSDTGEPIPADWGLEPAPAVAPTPAPQAAPAQPQTFVQQPAAQAEDLLRAQIIQQINDTDLAEGHVAAANLMARYQQENPRLNLLPAQRSIPQRVPTPQEMAKFVDDRYALHRRHEREQIKAFDRGMTAIETDMGEGFLDAKVEYNGVPMSREQAIEAYCEQTGESDPETALQKVDQAGVRATIKEQARAELMTELQTAQAAQGTPGQSFGGPPPAPAPSAEHSALMQKVHGDKVRIGPPQD